MKKIILYFALACLLLSFAGCGSTPNGDADMENENADRNDSIIDEVILTTEIKELESGFSAVKYDGDYAFDLFLEQGGADSDQAVLRFLTDHLLNGNAPVKSSKIITGFSGDAWYNPSVSSVYPKMNDCPAINTGVSYSSL